MKYLSMIVIDPLVGFCSPSGSLGLSYGSAELEEITTVVPHIKRALDQSYKRHLVKSEYSVGQFTEGNAEHALANLCVPQANKDCDVIAELSSISYHSSTLKHLPSAMSVNTFSSAIENDLESGIKHFVIAGFLLEYCIKASAVALVNKVQNSGATVFVCSDLTASRVEKYKNGAVASTIKFLNEHGVQYCEWQCVDP